MTDTNDLLIRSALLANQPWIEGEVYDVLHGLSAEVERLQAAAWPKFCPICMAEFHADGTVTPTEGP